MKTCFLFGHRRVEEELFQRLAACVAEHAERLGVGEFLVGTRGGFDAMAARAVRDAKKTCPEIRLTLLLAYCPLGAALPEGFDGALFPEGIERVPPRYAIARANRYALEHSDCAIAYARYPAGNAWRLLERARRRGLPAVNLAEGRPG